MHFQTATVLAAAVLGAFPVAAWQQGYNYRAKPKCYLDVRYTTHYDCVLQKPSKTTTDTKTSTVPCTKTQTNFVYTTVTPSTTTTATTETTTTTSYTVSTSVFTTYSTSTVVTTTSQAPYTVWATGTATFSTDGTTTVDVPTGFVPVISSLPNAGYDTSYSSGGSRRKRGERNVRRTSYSYYKFGTSKNVKYVPKQGTCATKNQVSYRGSCHVQAIVKNCKTVQVTSTLTRTAGRSTRTAWTTHSCTRSFAPKAKTTTTLISYVTSTVTVAPTVSSSTTTTVTSTTSTTSLYAACTGANIANNVAGEGFNNFAVNDNAGTLNQLQSQVDTPYDCCVAAFTSPQSAVWMFDTTTNNYGANCNIFTYSECTSPGNSTNVAEIQYMQGVDWEFVIGNAPCGQWNSFNDQVSNSS